MNTTPEVEKRQSKNKCLKCGLVKDTFEFSNQRNGFPINTCKECKASYSRKHYLKNKTLYEERDERLKTHPNYKTWKIKSSQRQRTVAQTRVMASVIVNNAIKSGELEKKVCEVCGMEKVDAHHDDYSKPLSVRWLCRKHHAEYHRNLRVVNS